MSGLYQGRALETETRRARPPFGRVRFALRLLGAAGLVALAARLPWSELRERYAVLTEIRVEGLRTLDADRVAEIAGLARGQDLFAVDRQRARQRLLLHSRIERARVDRLWPRGVRVRVTERLPVLLVRHGAPWELDSAGVLLAPLADGVVADVPLLSGIAFEGIPAGARIHGARVQRGLAWIRALAATELQLAGIVSEIDVSDPLATDLHLVSGTRVIARPWPPGTRALSAVRVVLADLERRGTAARELDTRFEDQVIVRPARSAPGAGARVALGPPRAAAARSAREDAFRTGR